MDIRSNVDGIITYSESEKIDGNYILKVWNENGDKVFEKNFAQNRLSVQKKYSEGVKVLHQNKDSRREFSPSGKILSLSHISRKENIKENFTWNEEGELTSSINSYSSLKIDGDLVIRDLKVENKDEGLYQVIDNGVIIEEYQYKLSNKSKKLINGIHSKYYENGLPRFSQNFKNGIPDGIKREWYENGSDKLIENYVLGALDGEKKEWYEDGSIKYEARYEMNSLIGSEIIYYSENYSPINIEFLEGDNIVQESKDFSSDRICSRKFFDQLGLQQFFYYLPSGKLIVQKVRDEKGKMIDLI